MLKCLECNKEFSSILGLQAHQRHHKHSQSTSKKIYTCNECGKEFGMARNLSVHMRSHHGDHGVEERSSEDMNVESEENYQEGSKPGHTCPVCRGDFPDLDSLNGHVTSQHFRCPQCGEVFAKQRHVAEHVRKIHVAEDEQYMADHINTDMSTIELKQEPVAIKEENDDENIDVSSLTPSADQHYIGSPDQRSSEQPEANPDSNDISHNHASSPNTAQKNSNSDDIMQPSPSSNEDVESHSV